MTIENEIAELLKVQDAKKLNARIVGMKLSPVCSRCGGSGQYSFNQIDGSRCYGCNGSGHRAPTKRDMPGILTAAREAVNAGELDVYLQRLRDAAFAKRAVDMIFEAWKATSVARANSAASHILRDDDVEGLAKVRDANHVMAAEYERFRKVRYDAKIDATAKAELAREVIENIKAADFDVPEATVESIKAAMAAMAARREGLNQTA